MVIRVYAFYNRDSVVLWAFGTHLLFSFVMFVTLVCKFIIVGTYGCSLHATSDGLGYFGAK